MNTSKLRRLNQREDGAARRRLAKRRKLLSLSVSKLGG